MKSRRQLSLILVFVALIAFVLLGATKPADADSVCGPGHHWVDGCASGTDSFYSVATIGIDIDFDGMVDIPMVLSGPTTIFRGTPIDTPDPLDPGHFNQINTELVDMYLTGGGMTLMAGDGTGNLMSDGFLYSWGAVVEQPGDPTQADSFFDVFFVIKTPQPPLGFGLLRNHDPLRVTAVIDEVPPYGTTYRHVGLPITLYDFDDNPRAQLIYAEHHVVPYEIYWKDYNGEAPGGYMPDIDQKQDFNNDQVVDLEYCAPVAVANSLWWLDKRWGHIEIFSDPVNGLGYIGGDINGDGVADILDLVQDLAILMRTNVGHTGTRVGHAGIAAFIEKYHLTDRLYEYIVYGNDYQTCPALFSYLEDQVYACQDVKLDLGFWHVDHVEGQPGNWLVWWSRRGGHVVTVAGVDSQNSLFAISDPDNNAAEAGSPGVVRPVPNGHPAHTGDPTVHNNEMFASHDIYMVGPSPSPGGKCGLLNYPWKWNFPEGEWEVVGPLPSTWPEPLYESMTFTEIDAAVIVSPKLLVCGNGLVEPGETCDPPGQPGPGPQPGLCSQNCTYCGDTVVDLGEQCDDGNANNNDGCRNNCTLQPDISVDPTNLDFAQVIVGGSSTKTVTISNTGGGTLTIGTITFTGTNTNQFSKLNDNCSTKPIAPSSSCIVDVKFSPTAVGKKTAALRIPSDDPDENPLVVSLKGKGAKVVLTSPNGGEALISGETHTITWQTSAVVGTVSKVTLKYTDNGGATWKSITHTPTNIGRFPWSVPYVGSIKTQCKVKVILKNKYGATLGSDQSDNYFKIKPQ